MIYREIAPAAAFAPAIECFWEMRDPDRVHRVVPDGCADILLYPDGGKPSLVVVGAMTRWVDFDLRKDPVLMGARFRPGMWPAHFGIPGGRITNARLPLEDLWGAGARRLAGRSAEASSLEEWSGLLQASLGCPRDLSPFQRAIQWMERRRGCISLDWIARQCALSPRQFRRVCLEQTGLTPKLLARILRFRHAQTALPAHGGDFAGVALDCGYYDQSHLIHEFRRFAGRTPTAWGP